MKQQLSRLINFNNLQIGSKMAVGYGIVVAVSLLTIGVSLNAENDVNREIARVTDLSARISDLTNQMAGNINNSQVDLNQYVIQRGLAGVSEKTLPTGASGSLAAIHQNIADLRRLATGQDDPRLVELLQKLDTFDTALGNLEVRVANITSDLNTLGDANSGLEGEVVTALNSLGARAQDTGVPEVQLVTLDALSEAHSFLIDGKPAHIGRFHNSMAELHVRVNNASQLSETQKAELLSLADSAVAKFDSLVNLQLSFQTRYNAFVNDSASLKGAVEEINQIGRSEFQQSLVAVDTVQGVVRTTQTVMLVILVGLIPAAILLAFAIGRTITRPVSQLLEATHQLAEGNLTARADIARKDEIGQLADSFNHMGEQLNVLYEALQKTNEELEQRVQERTRDLRVAADVSTQATTILNPNMLAGELARQLRAAFDFYYVAVFTSGASEDALDEIAGADQNSKQVKEPLRLMVDGPGVIAAAARQRATYLVNEVKADTVYLGHPELPETRSEMAVPMIVGDQLIGVLDFQDSHPDRFGDDERQVFGLLAKQIGIAIRNARSFSEAKAARERAEQADQVKSQFLASMSHELRTPLNAILNFSQIMGMGVLGSINEKQEDTLHEITDSGKHLLALINDVLDMSKIQGGMLSLFVEDNINLNEIIDAVAGTTRTFLEGKPVELVLDIDDHLPAVHGDKRRIQQVLLNLLSNAAKFTETGTITLRVKRQSDAIQFAVVDTGPGIPASDHDTIFEPFKQAEAGLKHASGTGLGLPISHSLVEAHGGRLWLESEVTKGASFMFTLPIAPEVITPQ